MASTSNIIEAMNNVTLEDEEEDGLAFEVPTGDQYGDDNLEINAELCLVGRFLVEGVVDFQAMKQTMAALWRPGKGVFIKEVDINLYLFQFYHVVDIKRVIEGSPWSFNRKALVFTRMKTGDVPRAVSLNKLDLWVQIHELRAGFMTEKVVKEVGNYIENFVASCPSNFKGVWREYLRVRVTMDLSKPLKRRMKIRMTGNDWFWIAFKYENVPTFCFICGLLGHSDKFCSRLFDTSEGEIVRPYGPWMRAPFRRQTSLIGAKWLREGGDADRNLPTEFTRDSQNPTGIPAQNQGLDMNGEGLDRHNENQGNVTNQVQQKGEKSSFSNEGELQENNNQSNPVKKGVKIIENKKRRTDDGLVQAVDINRNTELDMGSEDENIENMEHDSQINSITVSDPKNVIMAGLVKEARLEL